MNIRLPTATHKKLQFASEFYGLSMTEIGNKAMLKWNRSDNVAKAENKKVATRMDNPINIRFKKNLITDKTPDEIRYILEWYLDLHTYQEPPPLAIDPQEEKALQEDIYQGQRNLMQWQMELQEVGV